MERLAIQLRQPYPHVNTSTSSRDPARDLEFASRLASRRQTLKRAMEEVTAGAESEAEGDLEAWLRRSYPILAVLAPVLTTHEGKIEFPGDPMCLYSALSVPIERTLKAREASLGDDDPYNDLCPRWGLAPSGEYRRSVGDDTLRTLAGQDLNTDQTIFDPRVWNEPVRQYFIETLKALRPRVVLFSTVSPGHRYALAMAQEVRRLLPEALIVFGGRHLDETMRWNDQAGRLDLAYSSTLRAIDDGRSEPLADVFVSGEGPYALDVLLRSISIAMDLETKTVSTRDVVEVLEALLRREQSIPGAAVIAALAEERVDVFPLRGPRIDLSALPAPYRYFGIRARFPIFVDEQDRVLQTAHMMVTNACPFRCNFCSEAVSVVGKILTFGQDGVDAAVDRVLENVSYGAESIFFDDSVFWGGSLRLGYAFCDKLAAAVEEAATTRRLQSQWLQDEESWQRLARLQWGAQLTAEYLTSLQSWDQALDYLRALKRAGCNYIYVGIESLANDVMDRVHKNQRKEREWADKILSALRLAKEAEIRVGSSVLFGLEGETRKTIEETIEGVARLLDEELLWIASPNILTYHPGTAITAAHGMVDKVDYHSLSMDNRPPYVFFEEAFPGVVSRNLSEDDIWYIHTETEKRWGERRNDNPMLETRIPVQDAAAQSIRDTAAQSIQDAAF